MADKKSMPSTSKAESGRLSSLGRPRDLNLSSGTKSKKVYAPNINAVRNKNKAVPTQTSEGNKRQSRSQANKEFKRNTSDRYVQSTGIFSEGTNETKRSALIADRATEARDAAESSAGMEKPKLDRNATWNIDINAESEVINDLLQCNFFEERPETNQYQPIVLPLKRNSENFFKNFAPKLTTTLKQEKGDNADKLKDCEGEMSGLLQRSILETPKLFNDDNVGLTLVKLPNSMPGRGYDENDKVVDYTLDQMMEGQIGKIVKRRSGKMEMIIGNTSYSMDSIESSPFTEDVMVVPDPDVDQHNTSMLKLGTIKEKIIVSPSWHNLLPKKQ